MSFIDEIPSGETTEVRVARMLIDGQWVAAASGETLPVENPARRRIIAHVPRGRAEDVDRAVKAAHKAFPAWSRLAPRERSRMLAEIGDRLTARGEDLARLIALETGNVLKTQARPEGHGAGHVFRTFSGLVGEIK